MFWSKLLFLYIFFYYGVCKTMKSFSFYEIKINFFGLSILADICEDDLNLIQRFVCLMYDRTSTHDQVNDCRRYLFATKRRDIEKCPPTEAALIQHIKRAQLQAR